MKLRPNQNSTRPQIFEHYEHPWYRHTDNKLIKPNIMKTYKGMWIETYQLYKKAMKVINDEKKIKI